MKMADKTLETEKFPEFRRQVYSISHLLKNMRFELNKEFKGTGIG
jgi:hypothetical protein